MAYQLGGNTARLVFDDTVLGGAYAGLEVVVSLDASVEEWYAFRDRRYGTGSSRETEKENFDWFGEEILESWTLKDRKGKDIPPTAAGLYKCPPRLTLVLFDMWAKAMTDVSDPLEQPSNDGNSSAAE